MFKNKYLKYDPSITFEIFEKVYDKLIDQGWSSSVPKDTLYNQFSGGFWPYIVNTKDNDFYSNYISGTGKTKTTVQEILGYDPVPKDWTKATEEELIAECERRYPTGSVIKSVQNRTYTLKGKDFYQSAQGSIFAYRELCEIYSPSKNKWAEIVTSVEKDQTVFSEKELLEEIRRRYPIGTVCVSLEGPTKPTTVTSYAHSSFSSNRGWVAGIPHNPILYTNGKWAEIVSLPEKNWRKCSQEELQAEAEKRYPIGTKCISLSDDGREIIVTSFKHPGSTSEKIWLHGDIFNPLVYQKGEWAKIIKSPIEKEWFDCSIEELLEEAIRRYPTGCSVISPINTSEVHFIRKEPVMYSKEVITDGDKKVTLCDRTKRKWADITESTPKAKFKVGDQIKSNPGGWQFVNDEIDDKESISSVKSDISIISGNCVKVLYSKTHNNYWYMIDNYKNAFTEDCISLVITADRTPILRQAVHCPTQEQWDFVRSKVPKSSVGPATWNSYKHESCICVFNTEDTTDHGRYCNQDWYKEHGYQILSFNEWCKCHHYELPSKEDLVGRCLKALIDQPDGTPYTKDSIVKIKSRVSSTNSTYILEEKGYCCNPMNSKNWEILPKDFKCARFKSEFKVGDVLMNLHKSINYEYGEIGKVAVIKNGKLAFENKPSDELNVKPFDQFRRLTSEEEKVYNAREVINESLKQSDYRIGDWIVIMSRSDSWSSRCNPNDIRSKVKYPFVAKITNLLINSFGTHIEAGNGGWALCKMIEEKIVRKADASEIGNAIHRDLDDTIMSDFGIRESSIFALECPIVPKKKTKKFFSDDDELIFL